MANEELLHPESEVPEIDLPEGEFMAALSEIQNEAEQARINREGWRAKLITGHKLRYGIRQPKTFPWPGCANLHLPLIEKVIRRIKPNVVALVANVRPTATFRFEKPDDLEAASRAEQFFDFTLWNRVPDFLKNVISGADIMLEKGFVAFKVFHQYETRDVTETFRLDDFTPEETDVLENGIPDETMPLDENGMPVRRPMSTQEMEGFFAMRGGFNLDREEDKEIIGKIIAGFNADEDRVIFTRREVVVDSPALLPIEGENLIVPEDTGIHANGARWIVHRMWMSPLDLKARERDGLYSNVKDIKAAQSRKTSANEAEIIEVKERREGVDTTSVADENLIEIWELFCHIDLNGDGVEERCVVTYQPDTQVILRKIPLPYDHGKWPFVYIPFEITDGRWYSSRGVPEHLGDLQTNITVQHNGKLDRMTIQNSPTFVERLGGVRNGANFRWIPGQRIQVTSPGDFQPIQIPVLDSSFQIEENITRQWAEELMGVTDFGLSNPLATSEARTATEIQSLQQAMQSAFSLDATIWQDGMREVYEMIWALDNQYGPNEMWVDLQGQAMPISITRHEIQGKFRITPVGNTGNFNRQIEHQKAMARLQMFAGNPFIDMYELTKDALQKDDPRLAQRLLKSPEVVAAEAQQAQQAESGPVTVEQAMQMANELKKKKPNLQIAI